MEFKSIERDYMNKRKEMFNKITRGFPMYFQSSLDLCKDFLSD